MARWWSFVWRALALLPFAVSIVVPLPAIVGQNSGTNEITFSKDVAPIVFENCVYCHRPGEIAPFSMLTFASVRPWAKSIKEQVLQRRMPPWFADSHYGSFVNARRLSDKDIQTIVNWVDGGSREGSPADMPAVPQLTDGWQIGTPDLVVTMTEPYKLPATGTIPPVTLPSDYVFPEDTWVRAVEVRPGNRNVVHQALALVGNGGLTDGLHLYSPGLEAMIFRDGYGKFIPKGARINLQMHYTVMGQETTDRSSVGFKFATKPVHSEVRTGIAVNDTFEIPSPQQSHEIFATFPLSVNARIHAFRPDLHLRGGRTTVNLVLPDRTRKVLLSITDWSDYWHYYYVLAKPADVPRGSYVESVTTYDNAQAIPAADPRSSEKIHLLYFDWTEVNEKNKNDLEPIEITKFKALER
jgi:hypothetical protein